MNEEQFNQAMSDKGVEVKTQEPETKNAEVTVQENTKVEGQESKQAEVQQQKQDEVPQNGNLTIPPEQIDELRRLEAGAKDGIDIADGALSDLKSATDEDKAEVLATVKERLIEKFPTAQIEKLSEAGVKKFARDLKSYWRNYLNVEIHKDAQHLAERAQFDKLAEQRHPWLKDGNSRLRKEFDRYAKKYEDHFKTVPELTYLLANALKFDELLGKTKGKEGKDLNLTGEKGRGQPTDASPKTNQTAVQNSVKAAVAKLKENPEDENLRTNVFAAQIDEDVRNGTMPPGLARLVTRA